MNELQITQYLAEALNAAALSNDPKTRCGAVLANDSGVFATGFNRFPAGWDDSPMLSYEVRKRYQDAIIHAEVAALTAANPRNLPGSSMFLTRHPCTRCAAFIAQCMATFGGPEHVYCPPLPADSEWIVDEDYIPINLAAAGVTLHIIK